MPDFPKEALFSLLLCVSTYEVDAERRLRLSALLRWQQEAGERHAAGYGMGWNDTAKDGLAFVLVRGCGVCHRLPAAGESVTMETWSDRVSGLQFYRGYRLIDEAGAPLVESMAAFVLLDLTTRRLHRPTEQEAVRLPSFRRESGCPLPSPLRRVPPLEAVMEWPVRRSAVDFNRHMNNTVYADLLTDCLSEETARRPIRTYDLQYSAEATEGDRLTLSVGEGPEGVYVAADRGDTRCFVGRLGF